MRAIVDLPSLVVRYGESSWPFRLDLTSGSAAIELRNLTYEVFPLSWGAKLRLARFTRIGQKFVQARFIETCLRSLPAPVEEDDEPIVAALASWINRPSEETLGLPLDQNQLAAVTLELCRELHLAPMALGELNATEVELLWASLDQQRSEHEMDRAVDTHLTEPLRSMNVPESLFDTKILILPDQTRFEDVRRSDLSEAALPVEDSVSQPGSSGAPVTIEEASEETIPLSRAANGRGETQPARFRVSIDNATKVARKSVAFSQQPFKQSPGRTRPLKPTGSEKLRSDLAAINNADHSKPSNEQEISLDIEIPTSSESPSLTTSRVNVTRVALSKWPELERRDELESALQAEEMQSMLDRFCERLAEAAEDLGILEEV